MRQSATATPLPRCSGYQCSPPVTVVPSEVAVPLPVAEVAPAAIAGCAGINPAKVSLYQASCSGGGCNWELLPSYIVPVGPRTAAGPRARGWGERAVGLRQCRSRDCNQRGSRNHNYSEHTKISLIRILFGVCVKLQRLPQFADIGS